MKKAFITITTDGKVVEEFGGDLVGVCCGAESLELQKALKRNGVELALQNIRCHLPLEKIVEAKTNNACVQKKGE